MIIVYTTWETSLGVSICLDTDWLVPRFEKEFTKEDYSKTWKLKLKTLCIVFNWEIICIMPLIVRKIAIFLFLYQRLQTESLQGPDR